MSFHGADTAQLRAQGKMFEHCARIMIERSSALSSSVLSMTWNGADAVGFRARWAQLAHQLNAAATGLDHLGHELTAHAEQQDDASAAHAEVQAGEQVGVAATGGGALGAAASALSGSEPTAAIRVASVKEPIVTDDFQHERGGDGTERTVTVTLPNGTQVEVSADGDSHSAALGPHTVEQTVDAGSAEITLELEIGPQVEVTIHEDGSRTYTFTGVSQQSLEAGVQGKHFGLEAGQSMTTEGVYSVTVPPGTGVEDAMQINPFNPNSIPAGASVAFGDGIEHASSLEVSGKYRGIEAGLGIERAVGRENVSVSTRDEQGNLSLLTGPTDLVSSDDSLNIGMSRAALKLGMAQEHEHGVLEYVEFADDPAGHAAYSQALHGQGYPADTSADGVVGRYTQTHSSTTTDSSLSAEIDGLLDARSSHNVSADETIIRDYPDGRQEWAQQVIPHGEASNNSVLVTGGSDTDTSYLMTLGDVPADVVNYELESQWDHSHGGGDLQLSLTPEEVATMRENQSVYHGDPNQYRNGTDYLASVVATESGQDASLVMSDLYNHYNYRPLEPGRWSDVEIVHAEERIPGQFQ